ncbi:MAG: transposase [Deltaproteobacteria bacterium]|nr:transposase [Deltaproteobacteria bacterium]
MHKVRRDRHFCEQLEWNLLIRWFLEMNADEPIFDASSFSRHRDRLLEQTLPGAIEGPDPVPPGSEARCVPYPPMGTR